MSSFVECNLSCVYFESGFTEPPGWSEPVKVPLVALPAGTVDIDAGYDDEGRLCAAGGCTLTEAQWLDYAVAEPGSPDDRETGDAILAAAAPGCVMASLVVANREQGR